jgi:hypothetical protein
MSTEIGKILGTEDAQPLDFWMAVAPDQLVQLDDVVFVTRSLPGGGCVSLYGIVDTMRARHEGAKFDSELSLKYLCRRFLDWLCFALQALIAIRHSSLIR